MDRLGSPARAPTPVSPRPRGAPSPTGNVLRSVESHVRLLSHLENISTSSSYTALRLRRQGGGTEGGTAPGAPPPSTSVAASSSGTGAAGWSETYTVTRVHRGSPTARFYEEVVAPCVSNSIAGQSYLFLVSGPHESGRSQTLYGSPHHREKGLVELTAEDLLARLAARENAHVPAAGAASSHVPSPTPTDGKPSPEVSALGGLTVTFSAFITRGDHMLDTTTGTPVPLVEFPPPLGLMPLPHMSLLENAAKAVCIPEKKHVDTSCVIQFHVYSPVDVNGRRSMATLTFVDVAALRLPFCRDVEHLVETVRRVAGFSKEGDARFSDFKLTTLLEPALVGYVTLVSITTISGRPDLYESACAALQFASDISRIQQVLMLTHIHSPKWLVETAQGLEQIRMQQEQAIHSHYCRGVYDYYQRATSWLLKNVGSVDDGFERLLQETESIRQNLTREVEAQGLSLQRQIEQEDQSCRTEMDAAQKAYATTSKHFEEVKRLDEAVAATEQRIAHNALESEHRIGEMRIAISALEAKGNHRHQNVQQLEKEARLYTQKLVELEMMLDAYTEELGYDVRAFTYADELERIAAKRMRVEEDLELASQVAHRQTDTLRVDRKRRSLLSKLVAIQQRVDGLKESVGATSTSVPPEQSGWPGVSHESLSEATARACSRRKRRSSAVVEVSETPRADWRD